LCGALALSSLGCGTLINKNSEEEPAKGKKKKPKGNMFLTSHNHTYSNTKS